MARYWKLHPERVLDPEKHPPMSEDNKVFLSLLHEVLDTIDDILKETYYNEEEYNTIVRGHRRHTDSK